MVSTSKVSPSSNSSVVCSVSVADDVVSEAVVVSEAELPVSPASELPFSVNSSDDEIDDSVCSIVVVSSRIFEEPISGSVSTDAGTSAPFL